MIIPAFIREQIFIPRVPGLDETFEDIREAFTYDNPAYIKLKKLGKYTGGTDRYTKTWFHIDHPEFGQCLTVPRGGTSKLRRIADEHWHQFSFIDRRVSHEPITHLYYELPNGGQLRPDQVRLVKAMFKTQNCLIRSPTGSGKTEVALKLVEYILKDAGPVLIIVWETDLMDEWIDRAAKRFGIREKDIGTLGGSKKKKLGPITVGMQQTLKNCIHKYSGEFGGVICDEIQGFAASTYRQVITALPAKYLIGISADERRHDGQEFYIYDMFGEVAEEIERAKLIEEGSIHDVAIRLIPTEYQFSIYDKGQDLYVNWAEADSSLKDFNKLLDDLCYDEYRNKLAWAFMEPCVRNGESILVITQRVEHAKWWDGFLRSKGVKSGLMIGGSENKAEFKRTKHGLRDRTLQAGVGTIQKIRQALDIPPWNRGFILSPTAGNKQQFEQIIGRLRRLADGKTEAICYYMWDQYLYGYHKQKIVKNYPHVQVWVDGEWLTAS